MRYFALGLFLIMLVLNFIGYCTQFSEPVLTFILLGGFIAFCGYIMIKT
jgi:hypothetical protein